MGAGGGNSVTECAVTAAFRHRPYRRNWLSGMGMWLMCATACDLRSRAYVEECEISHVEVCEQSHVEVCEQSHVEVCEQSHVEVCEQSRNIARGRSSLQSLYSAPFRVARARCGVCPIR